MAFRLSTGLRNKLLDSTANGGNSWAELLKDGILRIFSGPQPTTADDGETGTLLVTITLASGAFTPGVATNGLEWGQVANGAIGKALAEVWSGVAGATGTAGWFRFYDNTVVTGSSSTALRCDGSIATSGAELNMSNTSITNGGTTTIDSVSIPIPASS